MLGSTQARTSGSPTHNGSATRSEKPNLFHVAVLNAFSVVNHLDSEISICVTLGFAWFCLFNCFCWLLSKVGSVESHCPSGNLDIKT